MSGEYMLIILESQSIYLFYINSSYQAGMLLDIEIVDCVVSSQFWKQYNALCMGYKVWSFKSVSKLIYVVYNTSHILLLYAQGKVSKTFLKCIAKLAFFSFKTFK